MSGLISDTAMCDACSKTWAEHHGFNCDEPYADRKFRPLPGGTYPPNRDVGRMTLVECGPLESAVHEPAHRIARGEG